MTEDLRRLSAAWALHERWNFRASPPEADLLRYLRALLACANGDGALTPAERQWVLGYAASLGLSEASVRSLRDDPPAGDVASALFEHAGDRISARALLYDAIAVCASDHEYSAAERATIRKLAATLGVPEPVVTELEAVHEAEAALRARRLELVFSDARRSVRP